MGILLTAYILVESLKLFISLNNKSLRKLPLIDIGKRSPVLVLLLNVAALPKPFSEFCDIINTEK